MHCGTGPCSGYRSHKAKRLCWSGATPGGRSGKATPSQTWRVFLHPFKRQALLWEEIPLKSGCWRADLTMLGLGKAIAGIVPGNRHRLPAYFTVDLELLGQCVDHHRQVLLPYLGQGKGHMLCNTKHLCLCPASAPAQTHQDEVCLVCGQHQNRHMVFSQRGNDRPGNLGYSSSLHHRATVRYVHHQPCGLCHLQELGWGQLCGQEIHAWLVISSLPLSFSV